MQIQRYRCGDCVEPSIAEPDGAHVRYSDHERVVKALEAEIQNLKQQLAAPRSRSKKQKIEEELRRSDLTAQITGRQDIEYGHHESLPRGEHVANPRKRIREQRT